MSMGGLAGLGLEEPANLAICCMEGQTISEEQAEMSYIINQPCTCTTARLFCLCGMANPQMRVYWKLGFWRAAVNWARHQTKRNSAGAAIMSRCALGREQHLKGLSANSCASRRIHKGNHSSPDSKQKCPKVLL